MPAFFKRLLVMMTTLVLMTTANAQTLTLEDKSSGQEKLAETTSTDLVFDQVIVTEGPSVRSKFEIQYTSAPTMVNFPSTMVTLSSSNHEVVISYQIMKGNRDYLATSYIQVKNDPASRQQLWRSSAFDYINHNDLVELLSIVTKESPVTFKIANWKGYRSIKTANFSSVTPAIAQKFAHQAVSVARCESLLTVLF